VPPGYTPYSTFQPSGPGRFGPIAGFWARLGAYILDGILYGLLTIPFVLTGLILLFAAAGDCAPSDTATSCGTVDGAPILSGLVLILGGFVLVFTIYVWQLGKTGQTWGRRIVGIRVLLATTGQPIGVGKAIGRTVFAAVVSSQIFYLGYWWMLWDSDKQTWHDKIVGSNVYKA